MNATEPYQTVLEYDTIFKKAAPYFEPGETTNYSASNSSSYQAPDYVNVLKNHITWWNNDTKSIYRIRNGTAPEPEIMSIKNV